MTKSQRGEEESASRRGASDGSRGDGARADGSRADGSHGGGLVNPPVPDEPEPFDGYRVLSSQRIYQSRWCGLRRDMLELPGGGEQEYHVVEIPDAAVVVPVLSDGSIVLI